MSEDFTLEKIRVKERLESIESHMKTGDLNRQLLMTSFSEVREAVRNMETKLYGSNGTPGLTQRMDAVLKIADGIKWVLQKIFLAICSAIALAFLPEALKYLSIILTKHGG